MNETNEILQIWNGADVAEAIAAVLPCNGSHRWAEDMTRLRPFASPEQLLISADAVWRVLSATEWQQAFDSHPRLGETHARAATLQSLAWSRNEQAGLAADDEVAEQARQALPAANRAYEARFGRIFLLCASGKGPAEVLAILQRRFGNDPELEVLEAAEQQRRITQLRLRRWLGLPSASCDSV